MDRTLNSKVWEILSDDEKTALNLSINMSKSSWEAGEIMEKSHYKYLEIQKRGETLLRLFQIHYNLYGKLIPDEVELDLNFTQYIKILIEERQTIKSAVSKMPGTGFDKPKYRNALVKDSLYMLRDNKEESYQALYNIIMDFDRWNNFRILPTELQEPSAFKRRNKVRDLKQLELSLTIPTPSIKHIVKNYKYSGASSVHYAVIIDRNEGNNSKIIFTVAKRSTKQLSELTRMFIYIFETEELAKEFAYHLMTFPTKGKRNCREGLKFWPTFRVLSKKAFNYLELNNIIPTRRNQEVAFKDNDIRLHLSRKKKKEEKKFGKAMIKKKHIHK